MIQIKQKHGVSGGFGERNGLQLLSRIALPYCVGCSSIVRMEGMGGEFPLHAVCVVCLKGEKWQDLRNWQPAVTWVSRAKPEMVINDSFLAVGWMDGHRNQVAEPRLRTTLRERARGWRRRAFCRSIWFRRGRQPHIWTEREERFSFLFPDSSSRRTFLCFWKLSRANISLPHITTNKTPSTLI